MQVYTRPGQTEAQVDPNFQLAYTCDPVWHGLLIHNICLGLLAAVSPVITAELSTSALNKVIYLFIFAFLVFRSIQRSLRSIFEPILFIMSSYFVRSLGSRFEDVYVRPFVSGCNSCQQQVGARNI